MVQGGRIRRRIPVRNHHRSGGGEKFGGRFRGIADEDAVEEGGVGGGAAAEKVNVGGDKIGRKKRKEEKKEREEGEVGDRHGRRHSVAEKEEGGPVKEEK